MVEKREEGALRARVRLFKEHGRFACASGHDDSWDYGPHLSTATHVHIGDVIAPHSKQPEVFARQRHVNLDPLNQQLGGTDESNVCSS
jgi:hypothetical protein